ncbi:HAD-IA family hydrolase [Pseudomonas sp. RGM2987]|uniref:HAD-IA family hydrolase n=1 Tax=Pseudomonas sp. RGM2987 TaxID=2930090 RepID=UPI001FD6B299|nr:HAD-IA family hydrolase [Pseudomonas sp. RGM2987]MCJ8206457.1 HAD-IA family hydrolase [Pseudomonas sp. RGM2987]
MNYWFENDARLNLGLLADLAHHRCRGVKVFLASNQEHLRAHFLMKSLGLDHHCDGIFYSAALACRKPSLDFYKKVTELSGFLPEQLLLIDDTQANVQAARESGWHAIHWTRSSKLEARISDLPVIGKDLPGTQ